MKWWERHKAKITGQVAGAEEIFWAMYDTRHAKNNKRITWYLRISGLVLIGSLVWAFWSHNWHTALYLLGVLHVHVFLNYRYKELVGMNNAANAARELEHTPHSVQGDEVE